jgi:MFS family permease
VAGGIGDRVGFRSVLGVALAIAAVVVALMPLASGIPSLAAGNAVIVGCQAATSAMIFGLLALEVPAERRSATLNLVYLPLYLAGIVGPAIGAVVSGAGVGTVFALAAAILAAGALYVGLGLRRSRATRFVMAGAAPVPSAAAIDATVRELEAENPAELR